MIIFGLSVICEKFDDWSNAWGVFVPVWEPRAQPTVVEHNGDANATAFYTAM
jgi:hypothetical protein